jgi:integrase
MTEIKSSCRGLIKRAAKRQPSQAGTTFRVLRATFGSKLVQKGVPILEVSRLLGHSSVTITEQHYAAFSNQSAREAISMLDVLQNAELETSTPNPTVGRLVRYSSLRRRCCVTSLVKTKGA